MRSIITILKKFLVAISVQKQEVNYTQKCIYFIFIEHRSLISSMHIYACILSYIGRPSLIKRIDYFNRYLYDVLLGVLGIRVKCNVYTYNISNLIEFFSVSYIIKY